jgi:hypothetical protein
MRFINNCKQGLCVAIAASMILLDVSAYGIQAKPAAHATAGKQSASTADKKGDSFSDELNRYPGLSSELGRLTTRLTQEVKMPAPRSQSRLLPLLPESTAYFAAVPNYGEALHQALSIFREERKLSAPLNDWWQHGSLAKDGPELEANLEKFYQLSQYLGEEIVFAGGGNDKEPDVLLIAEIKKPGLKAFLTQLDKSLSGKGSAALKIYEPSTLAAAQSSSRKDQTAVLVRPDFLVVSFNLEGLRRANKLLDLRGARFASTPFAARLNRSYENGIGILAGVDLQKLIKAYGAEMGKMRPILEATGFSDAKFLIWEQADNPGQAPNHAELSFTGPRRSVASWLASPGQLGGLDFVSTQTPMAFAFRLKSPALIFDDIKAIDAASGSNSLASLSQMEAAFKVSLRDALFSKLSGDIAVEVNAVDPKDPTWKVILGAADPEGLLQGITMLETATMGAPRSHMEDGVQYYSMVSPGASAGTPAGKNPNYAMVDGYLIAASSHDTLTEAIRIHRSGDSLGRSNTLHAGMPQGYPADASALVYQNYAPMLAGLMKQFSPDAGQFLPQLMMGKQASVGAMYAEETLIRQASNNNGMSAGAVMIIAAVAIPNLLRSRMAANESSAVARLRTVNTAQFTYKFTYASRGYASELAMLGSGGRECTSRDDVSAEHACLINDTLGGPSCNAGTWCMHAGYRFSMSAVCGAGKCNDYVAVFTPENSSTGSTSFCSTSDGVVRSQVGPPLDSPITVGECQKWAPTR